MLIWPFVMCLFVIISIFQHLGLIQFFFLIDPWDKIILDIILLFITLGILHRMILMTRKAEKEKLADVIKELSKEIKVLKGEKEEDNSK